MMYMYWGIDATYGGKSKDLFYKKRLVFCQVYAFGASGFANMGLYEDWENDGSESVHAKFAKMQYT